MKNLSIFLSLLLGFVFFSCEKESDPPADTEALMQFETINSWQGRMHGKARLNPNPPLTGDTTETYTTSLKLGIGSVWVSMDEVIEGYKDTLNWIPITSTVNTDLILFEDYVFPSVQLPVGKYKSIKILFRNNFYRYATLASDSSVHYELLETMGSWSSPCDINDMSWANVNYFGPGGNHIYDSSIGEFVLVQEGEKIAGFEITSNQTAIVKWRLGAGSTNPCTTWLHDSNHNLQWDCGTDYMSFYCPPGNDYMWDFVVEYE